MTARVSEVIRGWLGWCPRAGTVSRQIPVPEDVAVDGTSTQGAGLPVFAGGVGRYRDQMLLWAVYYTVAFMLFVPMFFTLGFARLMLFLGIIAGLVFFAIFGLELWHRFERVVKGDTVRTGPERYIVISVIGIILLSTILFIAGLFSVIPAGTALVLPAFTIGFGIFIPWYGLILILVWERRTGSILMFDKKTFKLSVRGRSENVLH
jgi:hypothetical protein